MCECVLWQWHGTHQVKLNGKRWFLHGHVTFQFLSLIAQNLLLAYYRFEFKANYYNTADITLGSKCTTDRTLLPLGSKCYYGWDINYAWVRLLHFCQYGGVQKLPKITTAQILVNPKSHSVIRFWALDASFSLPLNFFFFSLESDKVYFIHRRLHPLMYFKYMSCFVGRPEWKLHGF